MTDAGFFRGTSSEQDNRFSDKEKKLLKQMKFADNLSTKVEMNKIKLDVLKPWISKRISELLGMEDDVVVEFVINQLEAEKSPDARKIQINLTGFLNGKNARIFTGELWGMLISAQESAIGIPASMVEAKKEEIRKRNEEQDRINETLKRTVSRFNDRLKQERESPPPSNRRDRSPEPSSRDRAPRSRSKDRDAKAGRPSSKPSDSADGKRNSPDPNSKNQDDSANQGKRNYRGRKSSSGSPEPNNKRRSRSRSSSRERRPEKRPQRDLMEEIKERRAAVPDRDRGGVGRDFRDRPKRRSRSPFQRQNKRSRSRSPLRGRSRRSPSPQRGFGRRRSPPYDSRFRPDSYRNPPPRRDSSADRHRKHDERRSRSHTPPTKEGRLLEAEHKKSSSRLLPETHSNSAHPNNKTAKRSVTPEPLPASRNVKKPSKSGSSSDNDSSSSSDRETDKLEKSSSKRKASASDDSSNSDQDQPAKKRKDKKKKKDKKHKKHKKHKKLKKSKKHSSDDENEEESQEVEGNGKLASSRIAKSFLKLVEPHKDKTPSSEDLERKLREKALMSMKKAATYNR